MAKATIICEMPPGSVSFDLNPEQIVMIRHSSMGSYGTGSSNSGTPAGSSPSIFKKSSPPQLVLNKVHFFGPDTKDRCDQLMNWMSPGGGMLGALVGAALSAATGVNLVTRPPKVIFQWGPAFLIEANISGVTARYTRFGPDGTPVRAEVDIRLQQQPSLLSLLATNPTSAGLPGRKAHTVTAGDSLARIATDQYGSPGRWRQLAEANGIDDPLRVRPGDRVYLPNPQELT
ncbi:LysM domain-containing protein [Krasilnikovia cinnamomea]|uniref:LysM domain-containing protein n=1 Tax=Krasilnikovia cinnamomea TaxID=349313 RepID=A0A4Q7ZLR5_9ACTN|nr:LysM peptidoglycan-binding domain-containing protein [Krasilnikovia cinnamomea]RZU51561.1 LysM domain-containing protein [Krasilnikovia cinnamomea]